MKDDAVASFESQTGMATKTDTLILDYVATVPVEPSTLSPSEFAIQSSNLPNTWHILEWQPYRNA
jgi:hypothetical protein